LDKHSKIEKKKKKNTDGTYVVSWQTLDTKIIILLFFRNVEIFNRTNSKQQNNFVKENQDSFGMFWNPLLLLFLLLLFIEGNSSK
jgi:hypothetical protein